MHEARLGADFRDLFETWRAAMSTASFLREVGTLWDAPYNRPETLLVGDRGEIINQICEALAAHAAALAAAGRRARRRQVRAPAVGARPLDAAAGRVRGHGVADQRRRHVRRATGGQGAGTCQAVAPPERCLGHAAAAGGALCRATQPEPSGSARRASSAYRKGRDLHRRRDRHRRVRATASRRAHASRAPSTCFASARWAGGVGGGRASRPGRRGRRCVCVATRRCWRLRSSRSSSCPASPLRETLSGSMTAAAAEVLEEGRSEITSADVLATLAATSGLPLRDARSQHPPVSGRCPRVLRGACPRSERGDQRRGRAHRDRRARVSTTRRGRSACCCSSARRARARRSLRNRWRSSCLDRANRLVRVDMSEFQTHNSLERLLADTNVDRDGARADRGRAQGSVLGRAPGRVREGRVADLGRLPPGLRRRAPDRRARSHRRLQALRLPAHVQHRLGHRDRKPGGVRSHEGGVRSRRGSRRRWPGRSGRSSSIASIA